MQNKKKTLIYLLLIMIMTNCLWGCSLQNKNTEEDNSVTFSDILKDNKTKDNINKLDEMLEGFK